MALQVMPLFATSCATDRTRPRTPCLEAAYAGIAALPCNDAIDAMAISLPPLAALLSIARRAALNVKNVPVMFTASVLFQSSSVRSFIFAALPKPALATTTSNGFSNNALTSDSDVTSAIRYSIEVPAAAVVNGSSRRPAIVTASPLSVKACAMALPIPVPPPVTSTLLVMSLVMF